MDPAGTGSFYNEGEAYIAIQHVLSLVYAGLLLWFYLLLFEISLVSNVETNFTMYRYLQGYLFYEKNYSSFAQMFVQG